MKLEEGKGEATYDSRLCTPCFPSVAMFAKNLLLVAGVKIGLIAVFQLALAEGGSVRRAERVNAVVVVRLRMVAVDVERGIKR